MPPLLLHVNLHLTTTVRPSRFRVVHSIPTFRAFLLLFALRRRRRLADHAGAHFGPIGRFGDGRPVAAANVIYSSATSNLAGAASSDASGYYYLPLLSPGIYQIRVTAAGVSVAGGPGTGTDRGGAHRARFPFASAQRRLGVRRIQERLSPRTEDHCYVLWSRRRPEQIGIVRSAEGSARAAGIDRVGSDRFRRNRKPSAAGPRRLHDAGYPAGCYFGFGHRPRAGPFSERPASVVVQLLAGWPGEQQLPDYRTAGRGGAGSDSGISRLDQQLLSRVRADVGIPGECNHPNRRRAVSRRGVFLPEERGAERQRLSAELDWSAARPSTRKISRDSSWEVRF